ncbi:MAG: DUF177 domain-containing protein [bacterium]
MKLDLRNLCEGISSHFIEEVPERIEFLRDFAFKNKIVLEVTIQRRGDSFTLDSSIKACFILECSRCLEKFNFPISADFQVFARIDKIKQDNESLDDGSLYILSYSDQTIDFRERVKDEILLSIPVKPLCKETCGGLCSICGQNLNIKKCNCKVQLKDPRWEPLLKLKEKGKNDNGGTKKKNVQSTFR